MKFFKRRKSKRSNAGLVLESEDFSLRQLDNKNLDINPGEIIVFGCVRNELLRLPYFLQYHRALGVDRFILVDNASDDGTDKYLLEESDVHVFHTKGSYAESRCGVDWLNMLLDRYGTGHWTLTLDADELLVYPKCEHVQLGVLVCYLESEGADALGTFLLDMYSNKSIKNSIYTQGRAFASVCNYFDGDTYFKRDENGLPLRGGPRHRLFWQGKDNAKPPPMLTKVPLVKWREGLSFTASTHNLPNVNLAPMTGALQHYKLFFDFIASAEVEISRKEHWDNASEYEVYRRELKLNPDLTAYHEDSIAYTDSMQLVNLGLVFCQNDFFRFLEAYKD